MTAPTPLEPWPDPKSGEGQTFFANAKTVASSLAALKWPRPAMLGALARAELESSLEPAVIGDHGEAHGLWQWHDDRLAAIKAATGIDIARGAGVADQCKALDWETTKNGWEGRADIFGCATANAAAIVFCVLVDRAGAPFAPVRTGLAAVRWEKSGLV